MGTPIYLYIITGLTLSLSLCSCRNDQSQSPAGKIPADVIHNPLTASGKNGSKRMPQFSFTDEVYDFGNINQGEKVSWYFRFKNNGNADLLIASASASCGCVVTEFPKNPVPPGEERMIRVLFDTEGRSGFQDKTVTLIANTIPNSKTLKLIGNVIIPGK